MDTENLIAEAKARFNHNLAKIYLKEKYESKLLIAEQGGLWCADAKTIGLLSVLTTKEVVLIDTFENPVKVDRVELLNKLVSLYQKVTEEWHKEWKEAEAKR